MIVKSLRIKLTFAHKLNLQGRTYNILMIGDINPETIHFSLIKAFDGHPEVKKPILGNVVLQADPSCSPPAHLIMLIYK